MKVEAQKDEMNFLKTPAIKCHRKVLQFGSSILGSILKFLTFNCSKKENVSASAPENYTGSS